MRYGNTERCGTVVSNDNVVRYGNAGRYGNRKRCGTVVSDDNAVRYGNAGR